MTATVKLERLAPADKHGRIEYRVVRDGELLGWVERHAEESWRKAGRLRVGMNGYARWWTATVNIGDIPRFETGLVRHMIGTRCIGLCGRGAGLETRREAVELLLAYVDRTEPRETCEHCGADPVRIRRSRGWDCCMNCGREL